MHCDLTDLKLFAAVAAYSNITRGAEASNMSLSSASLRISKMEASLGAPLLVRLHRGVEMTLAGETLARHARIILAQFGRMQNDLASMSPSQKHTLKILSNTGGLASLVPGALTSFLHQYPNINIDLQASSSLEIVKAILKQEADLGIISSGVDTTGLETRLVGSDKMVAIMPEMHRLANRDKIQFKEIMEEPFVGMDHGSLFEHIARHADLVGNPLNFRVRVDSYTSLISLVRSGAGIGVLPLAALEGRRLAGIVSVAVTDNWATGELCVCAKSFDGLPGHAGLLVELFESASSNRATTVR